MVAAKLVGIINSEGGRFLKQKKDNDEDWYELSTQESKAKVSHAIRDAIAAKDKTKANKAGLAFGKFMDQKQQLPGGQMQMQMQMSGGMSPMAAQQHLAAQNMSLTSMAQAQAPMFSMGGPQGFGMSNSVVQDQIQHLQAQGFVHSNLQQHPFMSGGMGGMGMGSPQQMMMQQRRHSQPASMQSMLQPEMAQSLQVQMGRNSLPGGSLRPSLQDRLTNVSGMAQAARRQLEPEGEAKAVRGDGTEEGDTEFLSLIDNVLGPVQSPKKGKRGRKG